MTSNDIESQIFILRNRGDSFTDIAAYFNISADKAQKLYNAALKKYLKSIKKFDRTKYLISVMSSLDDVRQEAWKRYNEMVSSSSSDISDKTKLDALRLIKDLDNDKLKLLKEIDPDVKISRSRYSPQPLTSGSVDDINSLPGTDTSTGSVPISSLEGWSESAKKLAAEIMLADTLKTKLKDPEPDPNYDPNNSTPIIEEEKPKNV